MTHDQFISSLAAFTHFPEIIRLQATALSAALKRDTDRSDLLKILTAEHAKFAEHAAAVAAFEEQALQQIEAIKQAYLQRQAQSDDSLLRKMEEVL